MTTETTTREAANAPVQPCPSTLEKLIDDVRRDCRQDACNYLEETVVPHGGE